MLWHSDMVGILLRSLRVVYVEQSSQLNIQSFVQRVAFLPSIITKIQDLTASLLTEICNEVETSQPITGEQFVLTSSNTNDGACLDIAANGFWGGQCEKTYVDVKVFNPHTPSNCLNNSKAVYRRHEISKKRL